METLCRLCGKEYYNSINILDCSNESLKLEIYNLLHIEIHQCDFLPTKVCTSCVAAVQEASGFIKSCHRVQKMLTEKYEADCKDPKETELVPKTSSSSVHIPSEIDVNKEARMNLSFQDPKETELVPKTSSSSVHIPSEIDVNKENTCNVEHSIMLEAEHSVFVEEPKKLLFVDPDELISETASDPLGNERFTCDNVNQNSRLLAASGNNLLKNEVTPKIKVLQNELLASPQLEVSSMLHSFNDSMNEELPVIKTEAIEEDECFAPDPLGMDSNETYFSNSENFPTNIIVKVDKNGISTNSVLLETSQNVSTVPINLNSEVHVETDQNYSTTSINFPTESIDSTQNIVKEEDVKSARDLASDSNNEMHEPDTPVASNETDEADIKPSTTGLSHADLKQNMKSTIMSVRQNMRIMSVLTSQKNYPGKEVRKRFEGLEKGKPLVRQDAWKDYFTNNTFRRDRNCLVVRPKISNIVSEKFKKPDGLADGDDSISTETDPQKLFEYCMRMRVAKELNLKNPAAKAKADRGASEQPAASNVPRSQSENESTNQSCSTASTDPSTAEADGPTNNNRALLQCAICAKKFQSQALYDDHLNMHADPRPYKCDLCSRSYGRRTDLNVHVRIIHARGEFKCSLCDYVAAYEGRLRVHVKTSHEKPFCCSVCHYRCGTKRRMEEHIVNRHQTVEQNPSEVCELCGGGFKNKLSLKAHQLKVHFPEPEVCTICGKRCPNQSVYKNHVTTCGKEKIRYTCDMCGQTYSKKASLKEHMNKHLNIKPYQCKHCNKQFFLRVRLLTHMAVHRAPTFQCEVCCKSFNRKDNMKSHMKKHFEKEET